MKCQFHSSRCQSVICSNLIFIFSLYVSMINTEFIECLYSNTCIYVVLYNDKFRKISKRDLKPESVDGARIYISSCIKYRIYNLVWHRALFASHITSFRAINIRLDFPSISRTKKSVQIFLDEKPRPKTVNVAKFFFPLGHNI